jgi:5'-3' exonuclease
MDWEATICDGYEADDALGMALGTNPGCSVVICSIDKDLLQLPATHYNFVKREFKEVDAFSGAVQFYTQLLCGDPTDNIRGCPGIGKVKAERAFVGCTTERELYERAVEEYKKVYKEEWEQPLTMNARLLYIWRKQEDEWNPPLKQEVPVREIVGPEPVAMQ